MRRIFGTSLKSAAAPEVRTDTRRLTLTDPLVIISPTIGFLNLLGSSADSLLNDDKAALQHLFTSVKESRDEVPSCDVLVLYLKISGDGKVVGHEDSLGGLIRDSQASIVVVASANGAPAYIAAAKTKGATCANLVMTLDRKGPCLARFLAELFQRMFAGKTMPLAWVELAPQARGAKHADCPETIFAAGISHIVFRKEGLVS
jgi:hypothetical protein